MLGKSFSLFFYLKKPKNYEKGPQPIYMRITVDGILKEITTTRECDPKLWIPHLECSTGKSESQKELNEHLSILKLKVFDARRVLLENDREITAESIRKGLISKSGGFVGWCTGLWRFCLCNFFADHLPHGFPELFRLIREQHRGNGITLAHRFFHDFSDSGRQFGPGGRGKEAKYT